MAEESIADQDQGLAGPTWAATRNFNNTVTIYNRGVQNVAAPPGPVCPAQPADTLGLDARLVAYLYLGMPVPGGNIVLPPGWPDAQNRTVIDNDVTVTITDIDYRLSLDQIQVLGGVIGSTLPQRRPTTANYNRGANWYVVPGLWRIRPFTGMILLGRDGPALQPAAFMQQVTSDMMLHLIDVLEKIRPDAIVSKYGSLTVIDKVFAADIHCRNLPAGNGFGFLRGA